MATLRLAANYIETMGAIGLNWGHLQLVHGSREIEVQAPYTTATWAEGRNITFAYPPERNHLNPDHTTGTNDPDNKYKIIEVEVGARDPDKVWELLEEIHEQFRGESPNFLYGLGQNSNSYVAFAPDTLLDVIDGGEGLDTLSCGGSGAIRAGEQDRPLPGAITSRKYPPALSPHDGRQGIPYYQYGIGGGKQTKIWGEV